MAVKDRWNLSMTAEQEKLQQLCDSSSLRAPVVALSLSV